jgi:hypothetical protein
MVILKTQNLLYTGYRYRIQSHIKKLRMRNIAPFFSLSEQNILIEHLE